MTRSFVRIESLQSIDRPQLRLLARLGIDSIADLVAYRPVRDAQLLRAAAAGRVPEQDARGTLRSGQRDTALATLLAGPTSALAALEPEDTNVLGQLGITTVEGLADWPVFVEAEELLESGLEASKLEETDPTAPYCVVPRCKKYTRNSKSFVSFLRSQDLRGLKVEMASTPQPIAQLFEFKTDACATVYLSYASSYRQDWIYSGIHLGEPQGSVSLFMGQDTQISVIDWKRVNRALRKEDTRVSEQLVNVLTHQRAVDEVARATAEEHQHGATSAFGANAATAGSFVAAGAVIGGVGGGISGALAGLAIGNAANVAGGAPTIAGAVVGTAVGSAAGAVAGSLVYSGATTLGFVETEVDGQRDIIGRSGQRIHERTLQNASSLRSFWSNIVTQSIDEEQQRLRTDRVTNYNKIHALNAIYFEILNQYRVNLWLTDVQPLLFVPFRPFHFDEALLRNYWWILRQYMKDPALVASIGQHFLSPGTVDTEADAIMAMPSVDEIESDSLTVQLNFSGSMISPPNVLATLNRELVRVTLITTGGDVPLVREGTPNLDFDFVATFRIQQDIPITTIKGIRIYNDNPSTEPPQSSQTSEADQEDTIPINAVIFESIKAHIMLRGRATLVQAIPTIADVEDERVLASNSVLVKGGSTMDVSWGIADHLRDLYQGITNKQEAIAGAVQDQANTEAKIANLIGFLNANRYGFTRLILQQIEREQLVCVLDKLTLGGTPLRHLAGTTPIGFAGGHVLLPLKNAPVQQATSPLVFAVDTTKLALFLQELQQSMDDGKLSVNTVNSAIAKAKAFEDAILTEVGERVPELTLRAELSKLRDTLAQLNRVLSMPDAAPGALATAIQRVKDQVAALRDFLADPGATTTSEGALDELAKHFRDLMQQVESMKQGFLASDEVSLPSSAIFMEPVLSNAKGAEYYDIRRNSHYDLLESPGIGDVDPNVLRARANNGLVPTVPAAVLQQQSAPTYPLPGNLAAALGEAGKLDLSTMLQTNAASLGTTLTSLSNLATELAKASASLTGDAQKEVLSQAGKVAEQIGAMVGSSLSDMAKLAAASGQTGPSTPPPPPRTLEEKGNIVNDMRRSDDFGVPEPAKRKRNKTLGAPTTEAARVPYDFLLTFADQNGQAYSDGRVRITATFFDYHDTVALNGGQDIELYDGQYLLPESYELTPGKKVNFTIFAGFDHLPEIGSHVAFQLPADTGVRLGFRMKTRTKQVKATSVTEAVDKVVRTKDFAVSGEANFKLALETIGNLGLELPFVVRMLPVDASASVGGSTGVDLDANLAAEYSSSSQSTSGSTTTTTEERTFEVTIPLFAWDVTVS